MNTGIATTARHTAGAERVRAWLDVREPLERQLYVIGGAIIDRLDLRPGAHVLDIGCGIARTAERLARIVGPTGSVLGIDILSTAIDLRRAETADQPTVDFISGDAQRIIFPEARFDAAFSRFGTLFFDDPVTAFANIGRALRSGGRLAFSCWRTLEENELDLFPLRAASSCLPADQVAAAMRAEHFTFADRDVLDATLKAAGYKSIDIDPLDTDVTGGGIDATVAVCTRFGSLGKILRDHPRHREEATVLLTEALRRRGGDDPALKAATWIVRATKPA